MSADNQQRADPKVVGAVHDIIAAHWGRDDAITGERIACLVSEMLGRRPALRRIGEAMGEIRRRHFPVAALSGVGYYRPRTPEELEPSVAEKRRRALAVLAELRHEKRQLLELRGQTSIQHTETTR